MIELELNTHIYLSYDDIFHTEDQEESEIPIEIRQMIKSLYNNKFDVWVYSSSFKNKSSYEYKNGCNIAKKLDIPLTHLVIDVLPDHSNAYYELILTDEKDFIDYYDIAYRQKISN